MKKYKILMTLNFIVECTIPRCFAAQGKYFIGKTNLSVRDFFGFKIFRRRSDAGVWG